jgi:RNA polymerase sigma-70 factor (ECF subfamily)
MLFDARMDVFDKNRDSSFDRLLRPHLDRLYRFAYRLTDSAHEADDLFQDVLVKAYCRVDDLLDIDRPGSWLCRVMYNHFIDNRRQFARRRLISVESGSLPEGDVENFAGDLDPAADAERADYIMRLDRALAVLSEEHRLAVLLHDTEGYKLTEIQEITGDPIGTIKSRLHRGRARLREILSQDATFSDRGTCKAATRN